jgi:hypothetical protein
MKVVIIEGSAPQRGGPGEVIGPTAWVLCGGCSLFQELPKVGGGTTTTTTTTTTHNTQQTHSFEQHVFVLVVFVLTRIEYRNLLLI